MPKPEGDCEAFREKHRMLETAKSVICDQIEPCSRVRFAPDSDRSADIGHRQLRLTATIPASLPALYNCGMAAVAR